MGHVGLVRVIVDCRGGGEGMVGGRVMWGQLGARYECGVCGTCTGIIIRERDGAARS